MRALKLICEAESISQFLADELVHLNFLLVEMEEIVLHTAERVPYYLEKMRVQCDAELNAMQAEERRFIWIQWKWQRHPDFADKWLDTWLDKLVQEQIQDQTGKRGEPCGSLGDGSFGILRGIAKNTVSDIVDLTEHLKESKTKFGNTDTTIVDIFELRFKKLEKIVQALRIGGSFHHESNTSSECNEQPCCPVIPDQDCAALPASSGTVHFDHVDECDCLPLSVASRGEAFDPNPNPYDGLGKCSDMVQQAYYCVPRVTRDCFVLACSGPDSMNEHAHASSESDLHCPSGHPPFDVPALEPPNWTTPSPTNWVWNRPRRHGDESGWPWSVLKGGRLNRGKLNPRKRSQLLE